MSVKLNYNQNDYLELNDILKTSEKQKIELQKKRNKEFLRDNKIADVKKFNELFTEVFNEYAKLKSTRNERYEDNEYTKQRLENELQKQRDRCNSLITRESITDGAVRYLRLSQGYIDAIKALDQADEEKKRNQYESILNESISSDAESKAKEKMYQLDKEAKLAKKKKKIQTLKKEIEVYKTEVEKINKSLQDNSIQADSIKGKLSISNQGIQATLEEKEQLITENEVVKMEIKELAKFDIDNKLVEKMDKLISENKALEDQKTKIKSQNAELNKENKNLRTKIEVLIEDSKNNEDEIEKNASVVMENEKTIRHNKNKIKELNKEIETLKDSNKGLLEKVSMLTLKMEQKDKQLQILEMQLKEKDKIIQSLEVENKELNKDLEAKNKELELLRLEKSQFEAKIQEMENKPLLRLSDNLLIKDNDSQSNSIVKNEHADNYLLQQDFLDSSLNYSKESSRNPGNIPHEASNDNEVKQNSYFQDNQDNVIVDSLLNKKKVNGDNYKNYVNEKLTVQDYDEEDDIIIRNGTQRKEIYNVSISDNNASRISGQTQLNKNRSIFSTAPQVAKAEITHIEYKLDSYVKVDDYGMTNYNKENKRSKNKQKYQNPIQGPANNRSSQKEPEIISLHSDSPAAPRDVINKNVTYETGKNTDMLVQYQDLQDVEIKELRSVLDSNEKYNTRLHSSSQSYQSVYYHGNKQKNQISPKANNQSLKIKGDGKISSQAYNKVVIDAIGLY